VSYSCLRDQAEAGSEKSLQNLFFKFQFNLNAIQNDSAESNIKLANIKIIPNWMKKEKLFSHCQKGRGNLM
jgi:hypothetical protein